MAINASKPKRKLTTSASVPRKRAKTHRLSTNDLPWKTVSRPQEAGLGDAFDGVLELEEVDDIEVVYEETDAGRVIKFNVVEKPDEDTPVSEESDIEETQGESSFTPTVPSIAPQITEDVSFDAEELLPNWKSFDLHPRLYHTLYTQRFTTPTPIQSKALPAALQGKDVVGVAETGSGKTLAYGLPILNYLLTQRPSISKRKRQLSALILAPTRELALQVCSHLNACINDPPMADKAEGEADGTARGTAVPGSASDKSKGQASKKGKGKVLTTARKAPPLVSIASIVGGMSAQKQRRILDRGVDILVATPGRLWDILQEDDAIASQVKNLRFLVLDEADRMIETGHFAELDNILRLTLRQAKEDDISNEGVDVGSDAEDSKIGVKDTLQTFVFSATLSKDLQRNLRKRVYKKGGKKKGEPASTLDDLITRLDFRDPQPEVIDISPEGGVVSSLTESKIECLTTDKDAYLYYFLLRYPGRSLVFLSSIDGIRRLMPLMELLELNAFPLHSQLEQRQRLKNLDRFKTTPNSILLATDIASRGLDIPAVDHVVHYQIPRTADAYVHRNGRTARASRSGFSLLMCAPEERRIVRALLGSVGRQESDIPEMMVELYLLDKLKARIQLARQIDSAQHKVKKDNHERNWLREAAEAMEIVLDSDLDSNDEDAGQPSKQKRKARNAKVAGKKAELKRLLAQPLLVRGVSARYITSGSVSIVNDMLTGEDHETMVGLKKTKAGSDLVSTKKRKAKNQEAFEEWSGVDDS